jgi:hypothetical protein
MPKTTEQDIAAQQRIDTQEVKQDAELFQTLLKHPGWPRYLAILEKVGNNFHTKLMEPLENSFQSVKTEFAKGALTGLSLAAQLPSLKIKEAAELRKPTDKDDEE